MKQGLLKKFLSFSYGSWVGLIIGFLATIISTRILPPEDFGKASIFTIAMSVGMIFITCGTDQSFVRFFYEEKNEKRGALLYNCLKFPFKIALITCLLIIIFNKEITVVLFETENFLVALMLALGILSQVIYRYGILVIRMQQKGNLFSILEILNRTFNIILLVVLYWFLGKSYEIIVYSTVITLAILTVIAIAYEKEYWHLKNYSQVDVSHSQTEIMRFGYPLALTMLISWLFQSFDKIALKHWSSFAELGLYSAALKIIALLSILQTTFTTFWTPVCYENFEKNPENKIFFEKMSKLVSFAMFMVAIIVIAGKDIIIYLLGSDYKDAANIMPFLVFMPLMYTISETTVIGINFYKKPKWHILIASISCLVNMIGNGLLVSKYGAIGASIATAVSYIVFFILRTQISLKYYKVNYGLRRIYIMILLMVLYAIYSITNSNVYMNVLGGLFFLMFILVLHRQDLISVYKKYT